MAIILHVTDGGSTSQLAFDATKKDAVLTPSPISWRGSPIDIGTLDLTAGELLGALDDGCEGHRRSFQERLACSTN